jgi:hypothetical protein
MSHTIACDEIRLMFMVQSVIPSPWLPDRRALGQVADMDRGGGRMNGHRQVAVAHDAISTEPETRAIVVRNAGCVLISAQPEAVVRAWIRTI